LICKTAADAARWYERLAGLWDGGGSGTAMHLVEEAREEELSGVFVVPVYLTKGLEFDAVLVPDADRERYRGKDDRKLLYIACSRALHRLALFYAGEASPWLAAHPGRGGE